MKKLLRLFGFVICAVGISTAGVFAQGVEPIYTPWSQDNQSVQSNLYIKNDTYRNYTYGAYQLEVKQEDILSALEDMYAARLVDELQQFGYDMLGVMDESDALAISRAPMGAVQDNYVLGAGDELLVTFTGQRTDQEKYSIGPNGYLMVKDLPPIVASGQTIAQARNALSAHLAGQHNTQAHISLSSIRQIGVLVVGHVGRPGRKNLNVFHTVLDALALSGGVRKDGSLRQIKLVRNGRSTYIDLYALLMHGAPHIDITLRDGDRVIVPPIGPTVAVSGAVKRPGIYEIKRALYNAGSHIKRSSEMLSLNAVLDFAGGVLVAGDNRFLHLALTLDGQEDVRELHNSFTPVFSDGSILSVLKGTAKRKGTVTMAGHTRRPGLHDLSHHKSLRMLLKAEHALGEDIYPLLGVIERWNSELLSTQYINFPLRSVTQGAFDLSLKESDVIYLFSNRDIVDLTKQDDDIRVAQRHNSDMEQGSPAPVKEFEGHDVQSNDTLRAFINEHVVHVRGAVRKPGAYPVADGATLESILAVSGGMTLEANKENIEVTSRYLGQERGVDARGGTRRNVINLHDMHPTSVVVSAGDSVRVNQKFQKIAAQTILLAGEVNHPGEYDILPGDKVSDLLARAGGLTPQAYPVGAILSREAERRAEEMRFRATAQDMQHRLASAVGREKNQPSETQIDMVRGLADALRDIEAVGRITAELDPAVLSVKPELDMFLEKGDRIYIPKRPLTVRVHGEVLSPANLQFRENKGPLEYIHEAGGFSYHADKDRAFVLYPDGSAEPLRVSNWNHKPIFVPPGSTIIIPRDPKPFDFIESAKDISQIMSNLAITSVFIDDIRD